jgi:hypothetical protein
MHLPCSKGLWRAKTRDEWEREYVNEMGNSGSHPRFIDLMGYDINGRGDVSESSLEKWMVQLDDFGTLVVSAASLADEVGFCER